MGFSETQSSDPLDLTYKSNFQILYSVTFFWLEQQHYQQRFHGFERFPIFHKNERYTIPGGSQPIDLLKSPPEKRHELIRSLQVLTSLLSLSDLAALVTTYYR